MNRRMRGVIFAAALAGGCVLKLALFADEPVQPNAASREAPVLVDSSNLLRMLGDYKNWTQVNTKRHYVPDMTAALCAAPPRSGPVSPHGGKFISVYVNPMGRKPMLEAKHPVFPVGSVVVKEKYSSETAKEPELLTVMVKRAQGYNPKGGDWQYLVVAAPKLEITASGKLENCQSCHAPQKSVDYVFRTYLPEKVSARLR